MGSDIVGVLQIVSNFIYLIPASIYAYHYHRLGFLVSVTIFLVSVHYHSAVEGYYALFPIEYARVSDHTSAIAAAEYVLLRGLQLDVDDTYIYLFVVVFTLVVLNLLIETTILIVVVLFAVNVYLIGYRMYTYNRPFVRLESVTIIVFFALLFFSSVLYICTGNPGEAEYAFHWVWHLTTGVVFIVAALIECVDTDILRIIGVHDIFMTDIDYASRVFNKAAKNMRNQVGVLWARNIHELLREYGLEEKKEL